MSIAFSGFLTAAFALCIYFMYSFGYIPSVRKRAAMFFGRPYRARFVSCTGRIRRVLRYPEDRELHLVLESNLSQGELYLEVTDPEGRLVLRMDGGTPAARLMLEGRKRYRMTVYFCSASGNYELNWF